VVNYHIFTLTTRCSHGGMLDDLASRVSACTYDILNWMRSNRLQLDADQTELSWCATPRRLPLLPVTPIRVESPLWSSNHRLRFANSVHVFIDADLSMRIHDCEPHASRTSPASKLAVSLVELRLDYGSATWTAIPASVSSAPFAVRAQRCSISGLPRSVHISSTLASLHNGFVQLKLAILTIRCRRGSICSSLPSANVSRRRLTLVFNYNGLVVRPSRLVTVGDRAFPVAGANPWNGLPDERTHFTAVATFIFSRHLKMLCCFARLVQNSAWS